MNPQELAIVIVSWNVRSLLMPAIRTAKADLDASGLVGNIWVVDNASHDGTADAVREQFPDIHMIASEKNLGFAAGNNVALRALGFNDTPGTKASPDAPKAVFLLNPDTLTQRGAIRALWDALFSLPKAGLVGAYLTYGDLTFQHGAFAFPGLAQLALDVLPVPNRVRGWLAETAVNGRYQQKRYVLGKPFAVGHTLGATMMLRREVIEQTGLFDEAYFMYVEEVDWAMRIHRAGWQIYTVPAAHVVHLEGRSTRQIRPQSVVNLWRSRFTYYGRYYSPVQRILARIIVRAGMRHKIRQAQQGLSEDEAKPLIEAYEQVMKL
jgi:N-acetylglucosaminyl-diphospho-decaprenol L-rhamnosyltransferase